MDLPKLDCDVDLDALDFEVLPWLMNFGEFTNNELNNEEKPYKCDLCSKRFKRRYDLKKHRRTHTCEKPYECEICHKQFTQSSSLARHRRIHTGEKPHACEFCEKRFTESSALKNHKRIHTREKPYKCEFCEKAFGDHSALRDHRRIHTGERPFKCDFCYKSFITSGNLRVHNKRNHTGETSPVFVNATVKDSVLNPSSKCTEKLTPEKCFTCESCQERFSLHKELKEHYKIHHQDLGKRRQHSIKLDHSYCMKALDNIVLDHPYYKSAPRGPPKLPNLSRAKKTIDGNVIS